MKNLKLTEIISINNELSSKIGSVKPYNIKILHNVTCNQITHVLTYALRQENINPIISFGTFDNIVQDSYQPIDDQMVVVMCDIVGILVKQEQFIESASDEQIEELIINITDQYDVVNNNLRSVPAVVWNTLTCSVVNLNATGSTKLQTLVCRINAYFEEHKLKNVTLIDITAVMQQVGLDNAVDRRMLYSSKSPYSLCFWKQYAQVLASVIFRFSGKLKKAIIFDCDNTLWSGILGEDGAEHIDMNAHSKVGQIFNAVQNIAVWLSNNGVIIGLCSKNNEQDVNDVIDNHSDMILRDKHIVIKKINWNDKASNLREIASTLNIGLDSLLFVDDSSFEINLVGEQLPQVRTMQVPSALEQYPAQLMELINTYFHITGSQSDIEKTNQYKVQTQREQSKPQFNSVDDYLKSLDIKIKISVNDLDVAERIAQLTQKTNQFNLTTKRYTQTQIEDFMSSDSYIVYSVSVSDKFGDMGLTAVVIVSLGERSASIDSFLMSCRVMGRNVEFAIMNQLVAIMGKKGVVEISGAYVKTAKNKPTEDFYCTCGFNMQTSNDERREYILKTKEYKPLNVNYITINV